MQAMPTDHPPGAVCMITGDTTRYALSMQCLNCLQVPPGSVLAWHMGVLIARSINDAFQVVLDTPRLQWAWLMGDDHTYEPDTVLRLLARAKEVVVPLCLNRMPPMDPTIIEHPARRMKFLNDLPAAGLYRLAPTETCGDAGLLIRRPALEALGPPWYDRIQSGAHRAEDQEFIAKIHAHGFDVWVDLETTLGHIGTVNFLPVRKNGHWEVRMMGGGRRHIADVLPQRLAAPVPLAEAGRGG